ncbi:hypothetical protein Pint_02755 [Pistacia integerrima]|uniref:Uncharacterized protein n=1 Tax=Pistacia integerrima TaxID=434235 RepID=A0ACC0ZPU0_9ROSI|nr:hypothetical protein Pint_02755 [Pistacia integerrima]
MDGNTSGGESDEFGWNTEDELEIASYALPSCSNGTLHGGEAVAGSTEVCVEYSFLKCSHSEYNLFFNSFHHFKASSSSGSSSSKMIDHFVGMGFSEEMVIKAIQENGEQNTDLILETLLKYSGSSSASSSNSKLIDHFVGMGFSKEMVAKAIQENGEDNTDSILETLLTYSALEKSPQAQQDVDSDEYSSELEGSFLNDFSDINTSDGEEIRKPVSDKEDKLLFLASMGYAVEEASIAMERCGVYSIIALKIYLFILFYG